MIIKVHTTNLSGCVEVEVHNQFRVPDCPPDFAPMDHAGIRIQANVKEETVTLELVVLVETPHLVWANSHKRSPHELFVPPCLNGIRLSPS